MSLPAFIDKFPGHTASGFSVTNEQLELQNQLLGRRFPKRAACIASAGEIPFFVLLPRCREVFGIDHSYRSLYVAYTKALLLHLKGAEETVKLLSTGKYQEIVAAYKEVISMVPTELYSGLRNQYCGPKVYRPIKPWDDGTIDWENVFPSWDYENLKREWGLLNKSLVAKAAARMDRLTLIHGDLTDLADYGTFNILYLSNATQHMGRSKKNPEPKPVLSLVADKGFVLTSTGLPSTWNEVKKVKSVDGTRQMYWNYHLYKKLTPKPVAPAPIAPVVENV